MITMYASVLNYWKGLEKILHDWYYRWKKSAVIWKVMDNKALLNIYFDKSFLKD